MTTNCCSPVCSTIIAGEPLSPTLKSPLLESNVPNYVPKQIPAVDRSIEFLRLIDSVTTQRRADMDYEGNGLRETLPPAGPDKPCCRLPTLYWSMVGSDSHTACSGRDTLNWTAPCTRVLPWHRGTSKVVAETRPHWSVVSLSSDARTLASVWVATPRERASRLPSMARFGVLSTVTSLNLYKKRSK